MDLPWTGPKVGRWFAASRVYGVFGRFDVQVNLSATYFRPKRFTQTYEVG